MLVHKTLPGLGMAFPEIAAGIAEPPSGAPTFRGLTDNATMTVSDGLLPGFALGERFDFSWPLHFDLRPGPRGRVVLRSAYDAPTVIVAEHGRGRVAVVGPHLGIGKEPTERQREFTLALGRWLVDR